MFLKNAIEFINEFITANFYSSPVISLIDRSGNSRMVTPFSRNSYNAGIRLAAPYISNSNPMAFGSLRFITNGTTAYYDGASLASSQGAGVIIGDGDVAPAYDDYDLSGSQITDFTATTAVTSVIDSNHHIIVTATYNITNTGASSFTVKEIGMAFGASDGTANSILMTRDLLATPVTIAPGDTGVVTYKIEIS